MGDSFVASCEIGPDEGVLGMLSSAISEHDGATGADEVGGRKEAIDEHVAADFSYPSERESGQSINESKLSSTRRVKKQEQESRERDEVLSSSRVGKA